MGVQGLLIDRLEQKTLTTDIQWGILSPKNTLACPVRTPGHANANTDTWVQHSDVESVSEPSFYSAINYFISNTCAFPAVTSQNVCCEKGLCRRKLRKWILKLVYASDSQSGVCGTLPGGPWKVFRFIHSHDHDIIVFSFLTKGFIVQWIILTFLNII